jgi:hypothetical protein
VIYPYLDSIPPGQAKVLRVAGEQGLRDDPFAAAGRLGLPHEALRAWALRCYLARTADRNDA